MRPRRLHIQAFGPFAGEVELDFDTLAPAGLYLIHGPTGAGKTSILDALCYALFGAVAGTRPTDGVRSHHAPPNLATTVELEFALHGRDYRVTRSPRQERPKKKGTGTTTQQPVVTLARRHDGEWEPVATRADEVARTLRELLPLDADQFQQVVMLPQGDFERALRADAHEREKLLSTLFTTRRFTRYADELHERARASREQLERHDARRRTLEEQAVERWRRAVPGGVERELPDVVDLVALRAEVVCCAEMAEQRRATAEAAAEAASEALLAARSVGALHDRRDTLLSRQRELCGDTERVASLGARVARAEQAAPLAEMLAGARESERRLEYQRVARASVQESVRADAARLPAGFASIAGCIAAWPVEGEIDVHVVGPVLDQLAGACERVEALRRQAEDAERARRDAAVRRDRARSNRQRMTEAEQETGVVEQERVALDGLLAHQRASAARATDLAAQAAQLTTVAAAAEQAAALAAELQTARRRADQARGDVIEAKQRLEELLDRRLANMAAELAGQLTAGEPCPVCGSAEHPQPASTADVVTAEERTTAERAVTETDALSAAAQAAEKNAELTHQKALAVAGDAAGDPPAARSRADALAVEAAAAAQAAKEIPDLEAQLAQQGARLEAAREQRAALERDAAVSDGEAAQLEARAGEIQRVLTEALGDGVDLGALAGLLADLRRDAAEVQRLAIEEAGTAESLRQRTGELERLLPARGFASVADLEAAAMTDDALHAAAAEVERHRVELATVERELTDRELHDLPARPDIEAAQERDDEARSAVASATREAALAADAAEQLRALELRHAAAAAEREPLARRAGRLEHLSTVCRGTGNDLRMSLERYVLAAHLEEITEAASTRLRTMTEGRYTLRHSDARTKGGGASGLSIMVHDAWTSSEREAASLSGGETFQASLALALGVADVVRRHRGGIELETLFVDEGFGSLDPDALDQAMAVLDQLRAGGRMVGLISHVPALKERIAAGIAVTPTHRGSHASVSVEPPA